MKRALLYMIFVLTFFSCEERINWDLDTQELPLLVVDGIITNERKAHRITLSKPVTALNEIPQPVSGALVALSDGDSVVILREDILNAGNYYTDSTIQGVIGKIYYLYIKIGEEEFNSKAVMYPVDPIQPLSYHKIQENENFYEITYKESTDPSMMKIYMDWSYLVPEEDKEAARAFVHYYTLQSIDVNELFKPDRERVIFPAGTIIIRKKYSLSYNHQEFLRSMLMETEWKGGVFDVLPANVLSNINGRAVGFFAASTVISDTNIIYPLP